MSDPCPRHPASPFPVPGCRRLLLVNPTRFLGNLLLAGGLIQDFHAWCADQGVELRVVIDEAFRELLTGALPAQSLISYPRARVTHGSAWVRAGAYLGCLREIRAWSADIAFNIEEDSVSHRLTQLSGARYRLGCSPLRHGRGYHRVLPIDFVDRPRARKHRWYSYYEVFAELGLAEPAPGYLRLRPPPLSPSLSHRLAEAKIDDSRPLVALHAGATKDYKKWPVSHFATLASLLLEAGLQPFLIGAGAADRAANAAIRERLGDAAGSLPDLCDRLSLAQLATLLVGCRAIVGNDSGPFHLASALGVPGVVLFGPTDVDLWRPLGRQAVVMHGKQHCAADCTRHHCRYAYRCLGDVSPQEVAGKIIELTNR